MANTQKENIRNIPMRRTWIEEKTEYVKEFYEYDSIDEAFQAVAVSLIFDVSFDDIIPEEIVDGGQDKQIDIIRIEEDSTNSYVHVHIIQAKNTTGFSSNTLIKMRNGLSWIFERPKAEYKKLDNDAFINKIEEIRQLRVEYGADSILISVYYVTKGDIKDLSEEYYQEKNILESKYSHFGFNQFTFKEIGAFELIELLNISEQSERQIDVNIPIIYDVNKPSVIEYSTGDTKAVICSIKGNELAKIACTEPRDAIFDLNVRSFYGVQGKVNSDIRSTCTNDGESTLFWFLNNGITMICDKFSINKDPDNPIVKVENVQVVNGCQTTATIREAWENNKLNNDVCLLLRIYETNNPSLVDRITLTTNNQNKITDRDLRANDNVQKDIQRVMLDRFDFYYERKNKEFRKLPHSKLKKVIPNDKAAQAYLAIVRKKPSIARGYLKRVWNQHYQEIFRNATAGDLLLSHIIASYCNSKAKKFNKNDSYNRNEKEVAVYGRLHIARVLGYFLTNDLWGTNNRSSITGIIKRLSKNDEELIENYNNAYDLIKEIRLDSLEEQPNPTLYFKALDIQREIEKKLYSE